MIGSIIGGALKLGGSIFGGISASKAMKQAKRNIEAQRKRNQDWYDRRYNEDGTQRSDAQRILTMTEESIKNRNRNAAGAAAVTGGSGGSMAAEKAANNKAIADASSGIAASAERRKDNIEATYLQNGNALTEELNGIETGRAKNIASAVKGVAETGASIAEAF